MVVNLCVTNYLMIKVRLVAQFGVGPTWSSMLNNVAKVNSPLLSTDGSDLFNSCSANLFKCLTLGASVWEKHGHDFDCLFYWKHMTTVLNRPLATRGLQRITTPVALGNSFSLTIWRAASSEGKAPCFVFLTMNHVLISSSEVKV